MDRSWYEKRQREHERRGQSGTNQRQDNKDSSANQRDRYNDPYANQRQPITTTTTESGVQEYRGRTRGR